jgi:hypothetical protein
MTKKVVRNIKKVTNWSISPIFIRYRLKKTNTRFYFLPTIVFIHNHDENFFDHCSYDYWKVIFKFTIFGIGISLNKDVNF